MKALIKRNGWEAVEEALCELARNAPEDQLEGAAELINAAYSLEGAKDGQLVRISGGRPAVH
jgi:hypothetical protein